MTTAFGQDLIESLTEAVEHATGKTAAVKVHVIADLPKEARAAPTT